MIKTFPWYLEALMIKMGKWTKKQLSHPLDFAKKIEQINAQTFDMDMMIQKILSRSPKRSRAQRGKGTVFFTRL
jgi:hypothetical protein